MARPRVLVSSTCADLYVIREQLKEFIDDIGYEGVLSEDGDIYYSPDLHVHLACLREVRNCEMVVLIVGNRFGSELVGKPEKSVTQGEHDTAYVESIPIFAFIDQRVLSDYATYRRIVDENDTVTAMEIVSGTPFGSRADIRVFEFIDDIRTKVTNNAYFPYDNFGDIRGLLKKQLAGMMFDLLKQRLTENRDRQVLDLLGRLEIASTKVEEVVGLIADTTVPSEAKSTLADIDVRAKTKRLNRLFIAIWTGFDLDPDAFTAIESLQSEDYEQLYDTLISDVPSKVACADFLRVARGLGITRPKSAFRHFSVKYRVDELRETLERGKTSRQEAVEALRDALTMVLEDRATSKST